MQSILSSARCWICLATIILLTPCLKAEDKPAPPKARFQLDKNVELSIESRTAVAADIYRPIESGKHPIVLMIHGGGWISGDKWNVADHARELALQGFTVVAINYRLAPKHIYPAMYEDCQTALLWIGENGEKWDGDVSRIGTWGYSAGAQLASLLAIDSNDPELALKLPRVVCCVAGGTPADLTGIGGDSKLLASVFGGTRNELPDVYRKASPIHCVKEKVPPFLLFHGDKDWLVPVENARRLHEKLRECGGECELFEVEGQGHLVTFINKDCRKKAAEFLISNLKQCP